MQRNIMERTAQLVQTGKPVESIKVKLTKKQKHILSLGSQFLFGGIGYGCLEILSRGYTHISMVITGGICFQVLVRLSKTNLKTISQCLLGVLSITTIEFFVGCIVNLWLKLDVWDYTGEAFHVMGQICPKLSSIWFLICLGVIPLCKKFKTLFV